MIVRSRAPLRLGLAGGGTDVGPFDERFGGAVLNATISLYARVTIKEINSCEITISSANLNQSVTKKLNKKFTINGELDLLKAVFEGVVKRFDLKPKHGLIINAGVDAPPGSGLGSSSTLVVAMIGALKELFALPLGEYDIAKIAYEIERLDLGLEGGKQDQYAATFGAFNFMEFFEKDRVVVNPLDLRPELVKELEHSIVLFNGNTSRISSDIIKEQVKNVSKADSKNIETLSKIKDNAFVLKKMLISGNTSRFGEILDEGWKLKRSLARSISNSQIDKIYSKAIDAGASGGKISGAGGGGFMFFFCPGDKRWDVIKALESYGIVTNFTFVSKGLESWKINQI